MRNNGFMKLRFATRRLQWLWIISHIMKTTELFSVKRPWLRTLRLYWRQAAWHIKWGGGQNWMGRGVRVLAGIGSSHSVSKYWNSFSSSMHKCNLVRDSSTTSTPCHFETIANVPVSFIENYVIRFEAILQWKLDLDEGAPCILYGQKGCAASWPRLT